MQVLQLIVLLVGVALLCVWVHRREKDMGGYTTVTASDGYEFKITGVDGRTWFAGEYSEDADGYICLAQYPELAFLNTTIELVEIPKPKPEADEEREWEIGDLRIGAKLGQHDVLRMNGDGRWHIRRYGPRNNYKIIDEGFARQVQ